MATSGVINGTLFIPSVDGTTIALTTSATLNFSESLRDATTKDSGGYQENKEGLREWSIDFDGLGAYDEGYNFEEIIDKIRNREQFQIKFSTDESGDEQYHGQARVSDFSIEAGQEESVSISGTFTGTGELFVSSVT